MRRILNNVLCKALCLALLACATLALSGGAMAAEGPLVLVLPFQVNAGPELPNASQDLPQMIADQLGQNGMRAVPMATARQLQRSSGESLDLATARELGRKAGARLVIYGKFNQLGQGFSMDTRIVPVYSGDAVPAGFERNSLTALSECTSALAKRAAEVANPTTAAEAAPKKSDSPATLVPMGAPTSAHGGLADVQVRGMKVLDPDTVLMRLTIRKGDAPDATAINEEVKRIWDMGYFSDVQATLEGNVLVFTVVEKPRIDNIVVE